MLQHASIMLQHAKSKEFSFQASYRGMDTLCCGMLLINQKPESNVPVTPQIRDVTGQRQPYTYASEALTY